MRLRAGLVALVLATAGVGGAAAQAPDTARVPTRDVVLPAAAGALLGGYAGLHAGAATGWGGGDDPGLLGAMVFGAAGAAIGAGLGAHAAGQGRIQLLHALSAGAGGLAGGLVGAWLLAHVTRGDEMALAIGYGLGHGFFTAILATH